MAFPDLGEGMTWEHGPWWRPVAMSGDECSREDFLPCELIGENEHCLQVFRGIPGWHPINGVGDRTCRQLPNGNWEETPPRILVDWAKL